MPGNVRRNSRDKFCKPAQFIIGVVESRDEKRNDFKPDAGFMQPANRVQNRGDATTKLAVESLEEEMAMAAQFDAEAQQG